MTAASTPTYFQQHVLSGSHAISNLKPVGVAPASMYSVGSVSKFWGNDSRAAAAIAAAGQVR